MLPRKTWDGRQSPGDLLTIDDSTTPIRAEAALRRHERLASIGTLAAGIAHEINNPLGTMTVTVETLSKRHQDLPEDVLNVLTTCKSEVVRDAVKLIESTVARFSAVMEVRLAETLPEVEILTAEYAQVLINLVQNALEAKAKHITVSTDADEAFVYLRARDNGTRVPSDQIPKLFDPLFSTRNESGGTGLGLSIVTDSHGSIEVESAPGEGSTMTVRLPRSRAEAVSS